MILKNSLIEHVVCGFVHVWMLYQEAIIMWCSRAHFIIFRPIVPTFSISTSVFFQHTVLNLLTKLPAPGVYALESTESCPLSGHIVPAVKKKR